MRAVEHDPDTVIVRVAEPDDALLVNGRRRGGRVLAGATTTAEIAATIERSRPSPTDAQSSAPRLLPTPASVLVVVWIAALAVGAVVL